MTLDDFITKYNGKGIDYDGAYGFQCVDLYRQYVKEVLGYPQSKPVPGAKDIWDNYLSEYFEKVSNTPTGVPVVGDIMIWGSTYGPFGHVAVVTAANDKNFSCFSQNDPIGRLCGIRNYTSYKGVLGWLHPKTSQSTQEIIDALRKERDDNWNFYTETKTQLEQEQATVRAYNDFRRTLSQRLDCDDQITAILGSVEKFLTIEDELHSCHSREDESNIEKERLADELQRTEVANGVLQDKIKAFEGLEKANKELQKAIDTCAHDLTLANEKKLVDKLSTGELFSELVARLLRKK